MIACSRCLIELAIDIDALARVDVPTGFPDCEVWEATKDMPTSPPSGENMPLVILAPPDCMLDPSDPDLLIHRHCATPDEVAEEEDRLATS